MSISLEHVDAEPNCIQGRSLVAPDLRQIKRDFHPNGLGTQYLYPAADAPENSEVMAFYRDMTGAAIW
jgi:hypothetical protein